MLLSKAIEGFILDGCVGNKYVYILCLQGMN